MDNTDYIDDTSKSLGGIIAWLLPMLQFGFLSLPDQITNLYINKGTFFFTSLITLLLSIFIILGYKSNPFFIIKLPNPRRKKYEEYFQKLSSVKGTGTSEENELKASPVLPPKDLDASSCGTFSILAFLFSSLCFIRIGLEYSNQSPDNLVSFLQSVFYIIIFSSTVYLIFHFSYKILNRRSWERGRRERIQNAINLAIENKSFEDFPKITFLSQFENTNTFPSQLIVQVKVGEQKYNIITNRDSTELSGVWKVD